MPRKVTANIEKRFVGKFRKSADKNLASSPQNLLESLLRHRDSMRFSRSCASPLTNHLAEQAQRHYGDLPEAVLRSQIEQSVSKATAKKWDKSLDE